MVVAAGNDGGTNESDACGGSPSSAPDAITVGATGLEEDQYDAAGAMTEEEPPPIVDVVAEFSDTGSCVPRRLTA